MSTQTVKDSTGATKHFEGDGTGADSSNGFTPTHRIGDGTNKITLLTSGADAASNTANRFPVSAWLKVFNGTTWDRIRSGLSGAQSAATGFLNILGMVQYNSSAPSLTNGQYCNLQSDSAANLKVNGGIYNGAPTEASVSTATSTTQLLAANASRTYLAIQNQDATNPIYVSCDGSAAVADGTCFKLAAGASRTWENGFIPNTAINAIATGGAVTTHVAEAS